MKIIWTKDGHLSKTFVDEVARPNIPYWDKLTEDEQKEVVHVLEKHLDRTPEEKDTAVQKIVDWKEQMWDYKLFVLGAIFGVIGNLGANLLEKYLGIFGYFYDIGVVVLIILMIVFLRFYLEGGVHSRLGSDPITHSSIKILEKYRKKYQE